MLTIRKEPNNPKMIFKCTFFDKDLDNNITSYGIEKICEEEQNGYTYNVVDLNAIRSNSI